MQGRLVPPESGHFQSFPRERWRDEFALANSAGLDAIEWIFDAYGEDTNPIGSAQGIEEIRRLSATYGISVRSLCADYFMDHPFLRATRTQRTGLLKKMEWLLNQCARVGITRMVIPFVDKSRIESKEELYEVSDIVRELAPSAVANQVELHLETALPPLEFARLLNWCPDSHVRVNFDSGNSASLGYNAVEEFAAYGDRIGSVHIKDRLRGGGTVPLGKGNADLNLVFSGLANLGYQGDFVLQIARANPGDERDWIAQNRSWVASRIRAASGESL